mgnify:CR=1 FL=1
MSIPLIQALASFQDACYYLKYNSHLAPNAASAKQRIAKAIGLHTHQKIDGNQEFIGQGLSNLVASFFSSYAGSGSFTRSGVNHQAGAKTPMSAIFASIFLMIVLLLFAQFASFLPKAAMGGIILLVG